MKQLNLLDLVILQKFIFLYSLCVSMFQCFTETKCMPWVCAGVLCRSYIWRIFLHAYSSIWMWKQLAQTMEIHDIKTVPFSVFTLIDDIAVNTLSLALSLHGYMNKMLVNMFASIKDHGITWKIGEYRGSYTSGHFMWTLWNKHLESFISYIWNDHSCKILFIIWPF